MCFDLYFSSGKMTRKSVLKRKDFLNLLVRTDNTKKRRNGLIDIATTPEIHALCEIITNLLRGNIPTTKCIHRRCKRYRNILRNIVETKTCLAKKRLLKKQSGGFFMALAPLITSLVSTLLGK